MKVFDEFVPTGKLRQFHEILCATGGRYLRSPRAVSGGYRVDYCPGDCRAQAEAWSRCLIDIVEVRKDQFWRKWLRRTIAVFKINK